MKWIQPFVAFAFLIGTLGLPFCPAMAQEAKMTHQANVIEAVEVMPPCCVLMSHQSHEEPEIIISQAFNVAPLLSYGFSYAMTDSNPRYDTRPPPPHEHAKFESRSNIKRE